MNLEAHLGTRLLHRTTRKLSLTASGTDYYERCIRILADVQEAEEGARNLNAVPSGALRVTMPVSFGIRHIAPLLADYLKQYPGVSIDIALSDQRVDLIEEGLDLAVRIGALPQSGLVARKLAVDRVLLCASPAYLKEFGTPATPADLVGHNCLLYTYFPGRNEWRMQGHDGEHVVNVSGNMRGNNGDLLHQAALDGLGIMRQPNFIVGDDIRAGRLVEVLKEYSFEPIGIYAVYPSRKHLFGKIRTFVDYLAERFEHWNPG